MMAMIDRRMDLPFFLPSSSLPWDEAEVREPVEADDPFRRRLKPGAGKRSVLVKMVIR